MYIYVAHRQALRCRSLLLGQGACVCLCAMGILCLWTQGSVFVIQPGGGSVCAICVKMTFWGSWVQYVTTVSEGVSSVQDLWVSS